MMIQFNKNSLAVKTSLQMALRVTVVVVVTAVLSYFHIVGSLERGTREMLSKYIVERVQKESHAFTVVEQNQAIFKEAFLTSWPDIKHSDQSERFWSLLERKPEDKTTRTIISALDPITRPDGTISKGMSGFMSEHIDVDSPKIQNMFVLTYDITDRYCEPWNNFAANLYVNFAGNGHVICWEGVNYGAEIAADFELEPVEWWYTADEEHNPPQGNRMDRNILRPDFRRLDGLRFNAHL